ncbi:hypothetical protein [Chryseobacterium sp. Bi04]|uniref:hypothetical protein n=1 Tax=Chryseobacterium sp. Bi04 TaxID=2822345 RepID=UPI001D4E09C0|nr:hypothetical protein [Chryseobacterium sp. Bi04]CAH0209739.1 hypothetical protein SRABI04_02196 [Chryseobacterium sp. Bi04]
MKNNLLHHYLILISFILILIFNSCNAFRAQELKYHTSYDNLELTEKEKNIDKIIKDKFNVVFEELFKSDKIDIYINGKNKFSKEISTNNVTGESAFFSSNDKIISSFIIYVNNNKIELKNSDLIKFKYLYIQKKGQNLLLTFSNRPKYYA